MARARTAVCSAAKAVRAFGFMLVLICARCSAFLVASSCSGRMVLVRARSAQHTHNHCTPQQRRGALAMANDFQDNALGIAIGDRVRVKQMEQRFYHIQAFKDDGLDATGFEGEVKDTFKGDVLYATGFEGEVKDAFKDDGLDATGFEGEVKDLSAFKDDGLNAPGFKGEVKDIKLVSKKTGKEITANRPVMVAFTAPHKFMAHFEFDELDRAALLLRPLLLQPPLALAATPRQQQQCSDGAISESAWLRRAVDCACGRLSLLLEGHASTLCDGPRSPGGTRSNRHSSNTGAAAGGGGGGGSGPPPPVTAEQLQLLLEASVAAAGEMHMGTLFRSLEALVCELLDASSVRLLYVSRWHRKLFQFVDEAAHCAIAANSLFQLVFEAARCALAANSPGALRELSRLADGASRCAFAAISVGERWRRVRSPASQAAARGVRYSYACTEEMEEAAAERAASEWQGERWLPGLVQRVAGGAEVPGLVQLGHRAASEWQGERWLPGLVQVAAADLSTAHGAGHAALTGEAVYRENCSKDGDRKGSGRGVKIYWPLLQQDALVLGEDGELSGEPTVLAVAEIYREGGSFRADALRLLGHTMYLATSWVQRTLVTAEEVTRRRATEALLCIFVTAEEVTRRRTTEALLCIFEVPQKSWVQRTLVKAEEATRRRAMEALLCICEIAPRSMDPEDLVGNVIIEVAIKREIAPRGMDLEDLVDEIVIAAMHFTEADVVRLYLVDELDGELWTAAGRAPPIPLGRGLAGAAADTGAAVNSPHCAADARFDAAFDALGACAHTALCMPIPPPDVPSQRAAAAAATAPAALGGGGGGGGAAASLSPMRRRSAFGTSSTESAGGSRGGSSSGGTGGGSADGHAVYHRRSPSGPTVGSGGSGSSGAATEPMRRRLGALRGGGGGGAAAASTAAAAAAAPTKRRRCPTAVLHAVNKRGGEVFERLDEDLLRLFCLEAEVLLQQKVAEATLLKRRRRSSGHTEERDSVHARVQSSILTQYANAGDTARVMRLMEGDATAPPSADSADELSAAATGATAAAAAAAEHMGRRGGAGQLSPSKQQQQRSSGEGGSPRGAGGEGEGEGEGAADTLLNWDFNPFVTEMEEKCLMVEAMFRRLGAAQVLQCDDAMLRRFVRRVLQCDDATLRRFVRDWYNLVLQCDDASLRRFVRRVRDGYNPQPFHNFDHAFSVAHVTFMMFETAADVKRHLAPLDLISGLIAAFCHDLDHPGNNNAGLIAAFCHDLDHPGNNNAFEVNSRSPLALLHADDAVLERHHVHVTFKILLEEAGGANNILSRLSRAQFTESRKVIVRAILSTDMSQHLDHCARAARLLSRAKLLRAAAAAAAAVAAPSPTSACSPTANSTYAATSAGSSTPTSSAATCAAAAAPPPPPLSASASNTSPQNRRRSHYTGGPAVGLSMLSLARSSTGGASRDGRLGSSDSVAASLLVAATPRAGEGLGLSTGGVSRDGRLGSSDSVAASLLVAATPRAGGLGARQSSIVEANAPPLPPLLSVHSAASAAADASSDSSSDSDDGGGDEAPELGSPKRAAAAAARLTLPLTGGPAAPPPLQALPPQPRPSLVMGGSSPRSGGGGGGGGGSPRPGGVATRPLRSSSGAPQRLWAAQLPRGARRAMSVCGLPPEQEAPSRAMSVCGLPPEQEAPSYLIGDSLEDRASLVELLVHCADLSGQVMTTPVALEWGRRILQEFRNQWGRRILQEFRDQSDAEERLGLPITFVQISEESEIIKGQLFFLGKIVAPLWEPVAALFPELAHLRTNLDRNLEYYEDAIAKLAPPKTPRASADSPSRMPPPTRPSRAPPPLYERKGRRPGLAADMIVTCVATAATAAAAAAGAAAAAAAVNAAAAAAAAALPLRTAQSRACRMMREYV
ncbi:hypothetical protein JKP88DRAFT_347209 [Tribonema minus]|uniref:Phosphodiesterase n=1 Tax=Tribonema minus TaxID=303371 RepID=A0A835YJJ2_9STRA|nr:hypothetical protein JKP88DRAFT_347209 [Tribonema minus]